MKKLVTLVMTLVLVTVFAVTAHADNLTTEQKNEAMAKLRAGVTVDGIKLTLPAAYLNQMENYLNSHDVSTESAEAIRDNLNAAAQLVADEGVTSFEDLPKAIRSQVMSYISAAAAEVGMTVSYDVNTGAYTIKDAAGNVFVKGNVSEIKIKDTNKSGSDSDDADDSDSSSSTTLSSSDSVIKKTGFDLNATAVVALGIIVSLAACFVVVRRIDSKRA